MELECPFTRVMEADYASKLWLPLRAGLETLLQPSSTPLSMELLSRAVFNACCCGFADRLQGDLLALIDQHARKTSSLTKPSQVEVQMRAALPIVRGVFSYFDREYADGQLLERMLQNMENGLAANHATIDEGALLHGGKRRRAVAADPCATDSQRESANREASKRLRGAPT